MNNILREIRIKHWLKNLFVLAPILFTPEKWSADNFRFTLLGILSFSLVSSSVYIMNDLHDVEEDRKNHVNSIRPYAARLISDKAMYLILGVLLFAAILLTIPINIKFILVISGYLVLNLLYTYFLKKINYINYSVVALGFVLRVLGGCAVISVSPSIWIIILTFLLTYFISIVKFYLNGARNKIDYLQIKILAIMIPLIYLFYATSAETIAHFGTKLLVISVIPVIAGFIYTLYKIKREKNKDIVNFFTDKIYWCIYLVWLLIIIGVTGRNYF
ncbi:hypothetical protein DRP44_01385 [candidate division TA06 bacterium]|uniref:Prenyltransferase n=1 Tax=candidate division TA06 bacterium TaxID=2250710 RepID=A0A660SC99_UNCT6|nr:MAG: hypothetical protein DRP44_01385 [candidate division TA06 bacterium]